MYSSQGRTPIRNLRKPLPCRFSVQDAAVSLYISATAPTSSVRHMALRHPNWIETDWRCRNAGLYRFMLRSAQLLTDGHADGLMLSELWRSIQQATRWLRRQCILGRVESTIEQHDRMNIHTTSLDGQWTLELTTKQAHQGSPITSNKPHQHKPT